jgi:hypothetical protein
MSTKADKADIGPGCTCARKCVSISRWVNEPFPAWDCILTAHDVARLIRRPPWMLSSMAAVGRFPRKQRFRGKNIGWLKADVLAWMALTAQCRVASTSDKSECCRHRPNPPNQQAVPLGCRPMHASRGDHVVSSIAIGVSP